MISRPFGYQTVIVVFVSQDEIRWCSAGRNPRNSAVRGGKAGYEQLTTRRVSLASPTTVAPGIERIIQPRKIGAPAAAPARVESDWPGGAGPPSADESSARVAPGGGAALAVPVAPVGTRGRD